MVNKNTLATAWRQAKDISQWQWGNIIAICEIEGCGTIPEDYIMIGSDIYFVCPDCLNDIFNLIASWQEH